MQFIKPDINIDFIGKRKIAFVLSIVIIVISIVSIIMHGGPKLGIDFQGGTLIQVKFESPIKIDDIKAGLNAVGLGKSSVQLFGEQLDNEYLIRTDSSVMTTEGFSTDIKKALDAETETSSFYRRMVDELPEEGKVMFSRFLEIEEGHQAIVQAEIDALSGAGYWFDFPDISMEMG